MIDPEAKGYGRECWRRRRVNNIEVGGIQVTRRGGICVLKSDSCRELRMSCLHDFAKLEEEGNLGVLY